MSLNLSEYIRPQAHRTYKYTFLSCAEVKLDLGTYLKDVSKEILTSMLFDTFGVQVTDTQYDSLINSRLRLRDTAGGVEITITSKDIKIKVYQGRYKNFEESMLPLLNLAIKGLKAIGTTSVKSVKVEKLNIWPVVDASDLPCLDAEILSRYKEAIFSGPMLDQSSEGDGRMGEIVFTDKDFKLTLTYLLQEAGDKESEELGRVALKSVCFTLSENIVVDDIEARAVEGNQILFNAYHWAVSESVIKSMRTTTISQS